MNARRRGWPDGRHDLAARRQRHRALSAAAVHDQPTAPDRHTRPAPGPGGHTGTDTGWWGKNGNDGGEKVDRVTTALAADRG